MQLNITARHLDLTPALSDYVRRKIEKAERYIDSIVWAQAILSVEKHRHIAEIVVHTPGSTFRTVGESGDLYSAVDLAAHKIDLHLSKVKDRQRDHRKNRRGQGLKGLEVSEGGDWLREAGSRVAEEGRGFTSAVSEVNKVLLETKSLSQAIKDLNLNGFPFLLFVNERTNQINAVYKKSKGSYGLVEVSD